MTFSRQEYWSGLPFPSPGDLPDPGIEIGPPALQADLFLKFYFIFKLYNIVFVLPNIEMNPPQVYPRSPSWTLLPPPSPTLPLGRPSAPAPSIQYRASNLDWRLVSYMILYMFQWNRASCIASRFLTNWATSPSLRADSLSTEPLGKPFLTKKNKIKQITEQMVCKYDRNRDSISEI